MKRDRSLEERLLQVKEDIAERNSLIEEYKPFVASVVQSKVGRYVEYGSDEELSIGLLAFNEAIDHFESEKGNFLTFAKIIIQRRLIDYSRKGKKDKNQVIYKSDDDQNIIELYDKKGIEIFHQNNVNTLRKLEIEQYIKELQEWGLDFSNLITNSPKQKKTRELYKKIANKIVVDEELLNYIYKNRRLPIQKIVDKLKVHRKKVERGRIYIIALIIILNGDYEYLKDYI